ESLHIVHRRPLDHLALRIFSLYHLFQYPGSAIFPSTEDPHQIPCPVGMHQIIHPSWCTYEIPAYRPEYPLPFTLLLFLRFPSSEDPNHIPCPVRIHQIIHSSWCTYELPAYRPEYRLPGTIVHLLRFSASRISPPPLRIVWGHSPRRHTWFLYFRVWIRRQR